MDNSVNPTIELGGKDQKKGISGSTLKLVAIITMLIDHTGAAILERLYRSREDRILISSSSKVIQDFYARYRLMNNIDTVMRMIGRVAFPIFCFLLVEGMVHTHNKWKYAGRLAVFAILSEIPFDLAFMGKPFYWQYQNVFFTLLIGLLVMIGFQVASDKVIGKKWAPVLAITGAILTGLIASYYFGYIIRIFNHNESISNDTKFITNIIITVAFCLAALISYVLMRRKNKQITDLKFADLVVLVIGMVAAELLKTDYSGFGVLTIAIMYALRASRFKSMLGGCITLTIMSPGEATAFFDLILIRLYNGKRGMSLKYVFYLFYPVHLTILYLIFCLINR